MPATYYSMTRLANEASMQRAIVGLRALDTVADIGNLIRVEEW